MTTPGGAGTTLRPHARLPVLGASASIIGSELSSLLGSGPWLCPVPLQGVSTSACQHALALCVRVHQHTTRDDMGIPSPAVLVLSGRGYAELRHNGVLRSSRLPNAHIR